jgi:hypothetical protein
MEYLLLLLLLCGRLLRAFVRAAVAVHEINDERTWRVRRGGCGKHDGGGIAAAVNQSKSINQASTQDMLG